jgi:diguanylate cyclase (GGDEF)-like protein/PAS domain S-box-containing protein
LVQGSGNEPGQAEGTGARPPNAGSGYQPYIDQAPDLITVARPDATYLYVSPACSRLFGWDAAALHGRCEGELVHPDDRGEWESGYHDLSAGEPTTTSYRFACKGGEWRWVEATRRGVIGDEPIVVSTVRDVTARRAATAALQHQALTDPLTGVGNRTLLMDRLNLALRRLDRLPGALAVIYIDLDRFKDVNDSASHHMGDAVLVKVADRLATNLRPSDTLARMGGDEFVIVAESVADQGAAMELANRMIRAARQPMDVNGSEYVCTLSAGVAFTTHPGRHAHDLLHEADLALYQAKHLGRDRAEAYDAARDNDGDAQRAEPA